MPRAGVRRQILAHVQNVVFLCQIFLEVHILATTNQKPFVLGPLRYPIGLTFNSITSDPMVHAGVELEVRNLEHLKNKVLFLHQSFLSSSSREICDGDFSHALHRRERWKKLENRNKKAKQIISTLTCMFLYTIHLATLKVYTTFVGAS